MQWILLTGWSAVIICNARRHTTRLRLLLTCGLAAAMGMQLWLLYLDDLFTWQAALPLHLCSLFGVLSIFMLWHTPEPAFETSCFLGAPGAFLTLFFPAMVNCSHPQLMALAFYQLHVLVALMPLYWYSTGKPLPVDPRRTLIMGSGYLLFISWFNRQFRSNYLFLQVPPSGTPLDWLFCRGRPYYICSLLMLCMLIFSWLKPLYAYFRK